MQRFWGLRKTHKKFWFGGWILVLAGVLGVAQWQFDISDPIRTQVLGASVKSTPAPTIASGPSGATASTSATFTYSDSEKGVTFQCALDAAPLASCPTTGVMTYNGLAQGPHTFKLVAVGVTTSSAASRSWTVDTVAPPAPTFSKTPDDPTFDTKAQFNYRDSEAGVNFLCSFDGASPAACDGTGMEYKNLALGRHTLTVWATDAAGNRSTTPASWSWLIVENKAFGISGDLSQQLYPGADLPLDLRLSNPYNFAIRVTSLTVQVSGPKPTNTTACRADVTGSGTTAGLAIDIPANGSVQLSSLASVASWPAGWPRIAMANTDQNQDACKGTTFALAYSGSAMKR